MSFARLITARICLLMNTFSALLGKGSVFERLLFHHAAKEEGR